MEKPDSKAMAVIDRVDDKGKVYFSELRPGWDDRAKMTLTWKYDMPTTVQDKVGDVYEVTFRRVARGHIE
jgi:hypothetical protein